MDTVLVTGASGFIGTELCRKLDREHIKTYVLLRNENSYKEELRKLNHCVPVFCDLGEVDKITDYIRGKIDVVYHLAWAGVSGADRGDYRLQLHNVELTLGLIKAISQIHCKRFVGVGSTAEYDAYNACKQDGISPNIVSMYGSAKISAHFMSKILCNALGMEHVWAYLGNTYGSQDKGKNFINFASDLIMSNKEAKFTSGEQYYDFVYVTDIAQGLYCVGSKGFDKHAYYIGSGEPKKLKEYIVQIRDTLNPDKELLLGAVPFNGMSSELSDFDIGKLKKHTGYTPKIGFDKGIKMLASRLISGGGGKTPS